jgi:hypothetical protein
MVLSFGVCSERTPARASRFLSNFFSGAPFRNYRGGVVMCPSPFYMVAFELFALDVFIWGFLVHQSAPSAAKVGCK